MKYIQPLLINACAIVFLTGIIISVGCSKKDGNLTNSGNSGVIVIIDNHAFSPQTLTVSVGETVTWRNDQSVGHTVTSDQGSELNSSLLSQGQTYQHRFVSAGTHRYHCSIHPSIMTGTVSVVSDQGPY